MNSWDTPGRIKIFKNVYDPASQPNLTQFAELTYGGRYRPNERTCVTRRRSITALN